MKNQTATSQKSLLSACERFFLANHLSATSIKLYLADIKRFLTWFSQDPHSSATLPACRTGRRDSRRGSELLRYLPLTALSSPSSYTRYFAHLHTSGAAPSSIARSQAALKQLGTLLSSTYSLPNPTENLSLSPHQSSTINHQPLITNYIKYFTNSLKADHLSDLTIKSYKSDVTRYIGWSTTHLASTKLIVLLSTENIDKYLNHLHKNTSIAPSTLDRKLASLTRFKDWYTSSYPSDHVSDSTSDTLSPSSDPSGSEPSAVCSVAKDGSEPLRSSSRTPAPYTLYSILHTPYSSFLSLALLLLLISGLAFFGYRAFSQDQIRLTQAFPSSPVTPNRQLSFQGRLEDSGGTPITSSTNLTFKLFDDPSAGSELYSSGTCAITPDADGIFSTQIGDDCGSAIGSNVFTEYANVYLEVTVVAETLTPRQQIATVAYALNSETIQGFPISSTVSAVRNTVVAMNNVGQILVGEQSPRLTGVSGTFQISAPALSLTSATGSSGNIAIAPDGTGQVNVTGNTTSTNFFNIANAQLSTGSLITGTVANNNSGFKLINLLSGTSPTSKFFVTDAGQTYIAGNLGIGTTNPLQKLHVSAGDVNVDTAYGFRINNTASSGQYLRGDGTRFVSSAILVGDLPTITSAGGWTDDGTVVRLTTSTDYVGIGTTSPIGPLQVNNGATPAFVITSAGNLGIGTTNPLYKLDVNGNIHIASGSDLYIGSLGIGGTAGATLVGMNDAGFNYVVDTTVQGALGDLDSAIDSLSSSSVTGSGTANYLPKWTAGSVLGNSQLFDNSTFVGIGGTAPATNPRLYVNANSGNVGIGTTAPGAKLHITADGSAQVVLDRYSSNVSGNEFVTRKAYGTQASPSSVVANTELGGLEMYGYDGTSFMLASTVRGYVDGAVSSGVLPGRLSFFVNSGSQPGFGTEALTIKSGGNVGIGTTAPGAKLDVWDGSLYLSDVDVVHSMTVAAPTNVYGLLGPISGTNGGFYINGLSDTDANAINITGSIGSNTPAATTPAIVFIGNKYNGTTGTNTISDTGTVFQFRNHSTNLVTILGSGNVGIGTTSPGAQLEVQNTATTGGIGLYLHAPNLTTGNNMSWWFGKAASTNNLFGIGYQQVADGSTSNYFGIGAFGQASALNIQAGGNVGIGNTNPASTLDVAGTAWLRGVAGGTSGLFVNSSGNAGVGTTAPGYQLTVQNTGSTVSTEYLIGAFKHLTSASGIYMGYYIDAAGDYEGRLRSGANKPFALGTTGSKQAVYILDNGNVGIGTTDPGSYKLNVNGNVNIGGTASMTGFQLGTSTTSGWVLTANTSGVGTWQAASGSLSGSGTTNYITKWTTGGSVLGDSQLFDNSTFVGIGGTAVSTNPNLYVAATGNVGIGTTGPGAKLTVLPSADSGIVVRESDDGNNAVLIESNATRGAISLYEGGVRKILFNALTGQDSYLTSGNVGIGTTGPSYRLTVQDANTNQFQFSRDPSTPFTFLSSTSAIGVLQATTNTDGAGIWYRSGTRDWFAGINAGTSERFTISDEGDEWFTITTAGNVGIGTTNPNQLLQISSNPSTTVPTLRIESTSTSTVYGQITGAIDFYSNDTSTNGTGIGAAIKSYVASHGTNGEYTNLSFWTAPNNATTAIERLTITDSGNVGIGTTNPLYKLSVIGTGYFSTNLSIGVGLTTPAFTMPTGAGTNKIFTSDASGNASWNDITSVGVGGSGTTNYLPKWTAGTTLGNSQLFDNSTFVGIGGTAPATNPRLYVNANSGNVGIGTISPDSILDLEGSNTGLRFTNTAASADEWEIRPYIGGVNNDGFSIYNITDATNRLVINNSGNIGLGIANPGTAGLAVMNGNVGIGTTNPLQKLHVSAGDVNVDTAYGFRINNTATSGQYLRGNGTRFVSSAILVGDLPTITSAGGWTDGGTNVYLTTTSDNVGIGTTAPGEKLQVESTSATTAIRIVADDINFNPRIDFVDDRVPATYRNARISVLRDMGYGGDAFLFSLAADNAAEGAGTLTDRMIITRTGNVGIGTTGPGYKLEVAGTARINDAFTVGTGDVTDTFSYVNQVGTYLLSGYTLQAPSSFNVLGGSTGYAKFGNAYSYIYMAGSGGSQGGIGIGTETPGTAKLAIMNGNVGIGTTSPETILNVVSNSGIKIENAGETNSITLSGTAINAAGGTLAINATNGVDTNFDSNTLYVDASVDAVSIGYGAVTGTTGKLLINGNVGIGTTSPGQKFQVEGGNVYIGAETNTNGQERMLRLYGYDNSAQSYMELGPGWDGAARFQGITASTNASYLKLDVANGYLRFDEDGSEKMRITGGNVGIGTTNPTYKLDVTGTGRITSTLNLPSLAASSALYTDGSSNLTTSPPGSGSLGFWQRNGTNLAPATITDYVGIGTTAPGAKLHINQTTTEALGLQIDSGSAGNGYGILVKTGGYSSERYALKLQSENGSRELMLVGNNGNVGIGTTSPGSKLEVVGNIAAYSGAITTWNTAVLGATGNGAGWLDLKYDTNTKVHISSGSASGATYFMDSNVGIGTTAPGARMEVLSTTQQLRLSYDSTNYNYFTVASDGSLTILNTPTTAAITISPQQNLYLGTSTGTTDAIQLGRTDADITTTIRGGLIVQDVTNSTTAFQFKNTTGTSILNIDTTNGNVGIGTTSPGKKLEIASGDILLSNNQGIYFKRSDGNYDQPIIRLTSGNELRFGGLASITPITFYENGTELMRLTGGNVGIGTTNPLQKLHVSAGDVNVDTSYGFRINNTATSGQYLRGNGTRFVSSAILVGDLPTITSAGGWTDGGTNVYLTTTSDNVGIGTTDPSTKLHVAGNALIGTSGVWDNSLTVRGGDNEGGQIVLNNQNIATVGETADSWNIDNNPTQGLRFFRGGLSSAMTIATTDNIGMGYANPGTAKLAINGNVGIGTTAPSDLLHIVGANGTPSLSVSSGLLRINSNNSGNTGLEIGINGNSPYGSWIQTTNQPKNGVAFPLSLNPLGGNLGIGTTNPLYKLDVTGTGRFTSTLTTTGITNTGAITSTGGAVSLNASSNYTTSINTGSSNGAVTIGGNSNTVEINSSNWDVSTAGAISGLTGYTQSSGNFSISGTGTFGTGTGAISLNGDTTIAGGKNLSLASGTGVYSQTFTGTTTNAMTVNANSLSTGKALYLASTSTALSTGNLFSLDWSPTSATTATGDLFSIGIGASGTAGNLFNILDSGSSLFSVSETTVTSNLPTSFTSSGDVAIAYDLNFTNQTASYIKSNAPLYLQAGESFESNDLTLQTYNAGDVVLDTGIGTTSAGGTIKFYDSNVKGATDSTPIAFADASSKINTYRTNYTDETLIGALNEVYSMASGLTGGVWTDGGAYIYPTDAGNYGSTGMQITDAGNLSMNGVLTVDSTSTLTGLATMTAGFDSNAASTVTSLTIDGAATTALNISNTGVTTDINLQYGETIDNDVDGSIRLGSTTLTLNGTTTLTASSLATFTTAASLGMTSTTNLNLGAGVTVTNSSGNFTLNANSTSNILLNTNGGNVGIGTTAPGAKLEVAGDIELGSTNSLGWRYSSDNAVMYNFITNTYSNGIEYKAGSYTSGQTIKSHSFYTYTSSAWQERLTILQSGNVGIGTTNPTTGILVINGNTDFIGGYLYDSNSNLVLNDTIDIGSATTGIRVATTGSILDIDGNLVLDDTTDIGSATTGIRIATTGSILDIDGNLVLNDTTDIGSATTGIRISTTGSILDIDGTLQLNDNVDITGTLSDSNSDLQIADHLDPSAASTYDLGDATNRWRYLYVNDICFDGGTDCLTSSNTAGGWTDDGTVVRLTTSTDNVGIGTAAPGAKLDIQTPNSVTAALRLSAKGWGAGPSWGPGTLLPQLEYYTSDLGTLDTEGLYAKIGGVVYDAAGNARLDFQTTNGPNSTTLATAMTIKHGNVGIGTTSPNGLLQVGNNLTATTLYMDNQSGYGSRASKVWVTYSASDVNQATMAGGAGLTIHNNDTTDGNWSTLAFSTYEGAGGNNVTPAAIRARATNRTVGGWANGDLAFFTSPKSGLLERMRIDTTGNVGIGTTNPGAYKLNVAGASYIGGDLTSSNDIFASGGISTYDTSPSDNTVEAGQFCLGDGTNCITDWGGGASNYWTLSGSNLYPDSTSYNVGIGTISPAAYKLDVVGDIRTNTSVITNTVSSYSGYTTSSGSNLLTMSPYLDNALGFKTPYKVEKWNGSTWDDVTSDKTWAMLTDGRPSDYVDILSYKYSGGNASRIRIYYDFSNNWNTPAQQLVFTLQHTDSISDMLVEHADDSTITTNNETLKQVASTVSCGDCTLSFSTSSLWRRYLRIDFTLNRTAGEGMIIREIGYNSPGYYSGSRLLGSMIPMNWNYTQNVAFGTGAVVANGIVTIGTNTTAASGGLYLGTDTNLYRGAANILQTDDGFNVAGNVGIGTTAPGYALEVSNSKANWITRLYNSDATNGYGLIVNVANESASKWLLGLYSGSTYKMVVRNDGNVGIGTTNPSTGVLVINGNTDFIGGYLYDSNSNLVLNDTIDIGSATTGIRVATTGSILDIDGNLVLDDTTDIGSATTGIRVATTGSILDIDGNLVLDDTTDIGSSANGIRVATDGSILDINANLVLNDTTDIGSATTGIRISTTGSILDIDGTLQLNDNVDITGTISDSNSDLQIADHLDPSAASTYDLGDATNRWRYLYVNDICFDGGTDCLTSSNTAGGWTDDGTVVRLTTSTDNVGIGTTSPGATLEVRKYSVSAPVFKTYSYSVTNTDTTILNEFVGGWEYTLPNNIILRAHAYNDANGGLTVKNGGNVGIGTTSPATLLNLYDTVSGDRSGSAMLTLDANGTTNGESSIRFRNNADAASTYWYLGENQSTDLDFAYGTSFTDANTKFTILANGNVGIGTASPTTGILVINGNTDFIGGYLYDSNSNLVLNDTIDIGSATTGIRVATTGSILDIDGNLVLDDTTDIGSATTGIRIATTGSILDIDGNLVLNDTTDIGSATTGIRISTTGSILDIDGTLQLNDNVDITGTLSDSNSDLQIADHLDPSAASTYDLGDATNRWRYLYVNDICFDGGSDCASSTNDFSGPWTLSGSNLYPDSTTYNVGIGTTSPSNKLSVEFARQATVSSANAAAKIGGSDVYTYMGSMSGTPWATWIQSMRTSDDLAFPLLLNPNGSTVGIGTTNPGGYTLNVQGTGYYSSTLTLGSTLVLPNSNTLTGISGYTRHSAGISVGGAETYYINTSGVANLNTATIAGTGTALTLSGAATTAINISNTGVTTDINLQNGETIDNNTDGTILLTATTTQTSGNLTVKGNEVFVNHASSYSRFNAQTVAGQWAYLRVNNGSNYFDFATLSTDTSGALQFRPDGSATYRTYMTSTGDWVFNGTLSDADANLVLNDTVDIGSATTGIRISTTGSILDIDGTLQLNDNVDITGTISDSNSDLQIADHLDPSAASTYDLGDATNRWRYLYVNDICFDGGTDCLTSSNTAGGWTDDGTVVRLTTSTDNVGIGTAAPVQKLQVAGGGAEFSTSLAVNATATTNMFGARSIDSALGLSASGWSTWTSGTTCSVATDTTYSFEGQTTTVKVTYGTGSCYIDPEPSPAVTINTTYSKTMIMRNAGGTQPAAVFNFDNEECTPAWEAYGNGWYKGTCTKTTDATPSNGWDGFRTSEATWVARSFMAIASSIIPYTAYYRTSPSINISAPLEVNTSSNSFFYGGNVGIGTTGPTHKLEVVGSTTWDDTARFASTGSSSGIELYTSTSTRNGLLYGAGANFGLLSADTSWAVRVSNTDAQIYHPLTLDSSLTIAGTLDPNGAVTLPTTGISGAGTGSGLDADLLDGQNLTTASTGNTVMGRDASGDTNVRYLFSSYVNMSHGVSGATADTIFYSSTDNYIRKNNATGMRTSLGLVAGGAGDIWVEKAGDTMTGNLDMGYNYISWYDSNDYHSITSKDSAGNNADDLRINSYGALYINLDSNNNNSSGADFMVGRHGATGAISDWLFTVSGESGNVGIGTTNPSGPLEVQKNQNAGTIQYLMNNDAGTSHYAEQHIGDSSGKLIFGHSSNYTSADWLGSWVYTTQGPLHIKNTTADKPIYFYTGGATNPGNIRMTILSGGNVGIGTTNPSTGVLVINGNTDFIGGYLYDSNSNLVLNDTTDIGSATTGIRVSTTGSILDIDGNLVLDDTTDIGSATTGIRIATTGSILDIDGNLVLNDTTDIGSATTGIRISTTGSILDIDGTLQLNDNVDITGTLSDSNSDLEIADDLYVSGGDIDVASGDNYCKYGMWGSGDTNYCIGMYSAQTLGFLNDYAMTFGMSATANRGWLWRDSSDAASDGAMSLTTDGRLYVKSTAAFAGNVGIGLTNPTTALYVNGDITGNRLYDGATGYYIDPANSTSAYLAANSKIDFNGAGEIETTGNLILDVSGNVGIGTTAPGTKLQIYPSTGGINGNLITLGGSGYDTIFGMDAVGAYFYETSASRNFSFGTASSRSQLVLASTGNVGIGTTAPGAKLEVSGIIRNNNSTTYGMDMYTTQSSGTYGWTGLYIKPTGASAGTYPGGRIIVDSYNNASAYGSAYQLNANGSIVGQIAVDGGNQSIYFDNNSTGNMIFRTTTSYTERMRILSGGNVGIGTTNPSTRLEISGAYDTGESRLTFIGTGVNAGWIGPDSAARALRIYSANSDLRTWAQGNTWMRSIASHYIDLDADNNGTTDKLWIRNGATGTIMVVEETGNVGIGTASPGSLLTLGSNSTAGAIGIHNATDQSAVIKANHNDNNNIGLTLQYRNASTLYDGLVLNYQGYVTMSGGHGDLAENYLVSGKVLRGSLVSIGTTNPSTAISSSSTYQSILGAISTKPGAVMDVDGGFQVGADTKAEYNNEKAPIALTGAAPVLVTSQNGVIEIGDAIGISNTPGFGSKMIKAGNIVGKALEQLDTNSCTTASSVEAINWPEDDGKNSLKPCFILPDGTYVGKVMTAVNVSWYDPDIYLTDSGEIQITQVASVPGEIPVVPVYILTDPLGNIIDRIGAFSTLVAANIKAGTIETKNLIADQITLQGVSIQTYITQVVTTAFSNLRAGLTQTQELQTNLISPLTSDSPITVNGPVVIKGSELSGSSEPSVPTLTVDGTIDTTTISARVAKLQNIEADQITARNIVADTISANHIEGLDAKIASVSAQNTKGLSDSEITTITDRIKARLSELTGNAPSASDIPTPPEATSSATTGSELSGSSEPLLPSIASDSATLAMIDADFVTINNYLAVIGQATMTTLTVTDTLAVNTIQTKCSPGSELSGSSEPCSLVLSLQPLGGTVKLAANTLIVDSTGQVFVNGDLSVSGKLTAQTLSVVEGLTLGANGSELSGSSEPSALKQLLSIYNEQGIQVASIDASGSANLREVATQLITIASSGSELCSDSSSEPCVASQSALAQTLATSTSSNATAGVATLTSPNLELTIESKFITADSLVYLTPTSATYGKVLYVKTKNTCNPTMSHEPLTINCVPSFTVAIDTTAPKDIQFNWWVIQLKAESNL